MNLLVIREKKNKFKWITPFYQSIRRISKTLLQINYLSIKAPKEKINMQQNKFKWSFIPNDQQWLHINEK